MEINFKNITVLNQNRLKKFNKMIVHYLLPTVTIFHKIKKSKAMNKIYLNLKRPKEINS